MRAVRFVFPLILCALTTHSMAAEPADKTLRVEVSQVRSATGDVGCLLFNSADGYPEVHAKAYQETHVAIDANRATCEFKNVASGTYAAIVFHDENKNGKLDKNFVGMPKEGYAASNNERPAFSAPRFKEASFVLNADSPTTIKIQMGY
ncbi:DUF2141 domain-containing protein [Limnohabitans sp. JirII-31]|uniref:DUF2141 domain-containing protein n=1 Tax=Limnohabitans sp. JirII-31 TaxID=1977908 RepID=UPI000C1F7A45|nr:DUF2141 domain-containing protein [Limnohabitans sp. JirII-31]PIT80500.1 hypothetical protein B9Z41_00810 [Limnohabitans sp. JirII-31]